MPKRWRQWIKALRGAKYIHEDIISFTPFSFLRFLRFKLLLNLELFFYTAQTKRALKSFKLSCDILWLCSHEESFLLGSFDEKLRVCRIFDDHTQYYGFPDDLRGRYYEEEERLYRSVDTVFSTSQKLYHIAKKVNPATYYIPNAADPRHFSKVFSQDIDMPGDMKNIPAPVIGLVGKLNERLDTELLDHITSVKKEWSFVILGDVDTMNPEFKAMFNKIADKNNVYYLGGKPYDDIPCYLKCFNVCIIPYVAGKATDAVNPIKLYEYIAANKPVVMTSIYESSMFSEVVRIARNADEFTTLIEACLKGDDHETVEKRIRFSEENTWEKRAKAIKFCLMEIFADSKSIKKKWHDFYKTTAVDLEYFFYHRLDFNTFYSKILQYSNGKRLLETGIGTGISSIILADKGFRVTSIDSDQEILEMCRNLNIKYGSNKLNLIRMDVFNLGFKDNSFDLIFHQGVLEHFDADGIKKILNEQLRAASTIVFSVPSIRKKRRDFGDENLWTILQWKSILKDFKIIDSFGSHYPRGIGLLLDRPVIKDGCKIFVKMLDYFFAKEIGFVITRKTSNT